MEKEIGIDYKSLIVNPDYEFKNKKQKVKVYNDSKNKRFLPPTLDQNGNWKKPIVNYVKFSINLNI
jgi:hypothetical protein